MVKEFLENINWAEGRQKSHYKTKMLFNLRYLFDCWLIYMMEGNRIVRHTDPVPSMNHYRLNFILIKADEGGEFSGKGVIFDLGRVKFFRSDLEHEVSEVIKGHRLVLSFGFVTEGDYKYA